MSIWTEHSYFYNYQKNHIKSHIRKSLNLWRTLNFHSSQLSISLDHLPSENVKIHFYSKNHWLKKVVPFEIKGRVRPIANKFWNLINGLVCSRLLNHYISCDKDSLFCQWRIIILDLSDLKRKFLYIANLSIIHAKRSGTINIW